MEYVYLAGGLVALFVGGELLVRGATGIAHRLAIPPLLIGLTIVGFGTSTPELLVSVDAALRGVPDIAVGNIIGSNIANILLILGLSALIWPIRIVGGTLRRDTVVMLAATLLLIPVLAMGQIGRGTGALMVALLAAYLFWAYRQPGVEPATTDLSPPPPILWSLVWVAVGLTALIFGAQFLVSGAVTIARGFGVSEAFIGLTIVAIGTSLPEMATSLVAALRRQSEIAIGNIVGSNIFNILGILGLTAAITPVPVAGRFLSFDLPVTVAATLVLSTLLVLRPSIGRPVGLILLVSYGVYVWAAQG